MYQKRIRLARLLSKEKAILRAKDPDSFVKDESEISKSNNEKALPKKVAIQQPAFATKQETQPTINLKYALPSPDSGTDSRLAIFSKSNFQAYIHTVTPLSH